MILIMLASFSVSTTIFSTFYFGGVFRQSDCPCFVKNNSILILPLLLIMFCQKNGNSITTSTFIHVMG